MSKGGASAIKTSNKTGAREGCARGVFFLPRDIEETKLATHQTEATPVGFLLFVYFGFGRMACGKAFAKQGKTRQDTVRYGSQLIPYKHPYILTLSSPTECGKPTTRGKPAFYGNCDDNTVSLVSY